MYTHRPIDGQRYSNRVRANICRIMESRGMAGGNGLPRLSQSGLYKFVAGGGDMTITKLQDVAEDLEVSIFELLQSPEDAAL